jgi:hypothetical protein
MLFCFICRTKIIKNDSTIVLLWHLIYEFTKSAPPPSEEDDKIYSYPIKRLEEKISGIAKRLVIIKGTFVYIKLLQ